MMIDAKRCTKCGEYKPLTGFSPDRRKKGDGRQAHCKDCHREYAARWRARPEKAEILAQQRALRRSRQEWIWAEKSKPCERCGNTYHPVAMQFDHLPGEVKSFEITPSRSIEANRAEMAKCQLLCSNCHDIVTWERRTGETVPVS
jgi:hypothetical protein